MAALVLAGLMGISFGAGCAPREMMAKAALEKGLKQVEEKKYEEGARSFYEYVKLKPGDAKGYAFLYDVLMHLGRPDEAYSILQKGEKAAPDSELIDIAMGRFYTTTGQFEKAKQEFDQATAKNPDNPVPKNLKGIILIGEGDYASSYKIFKELIRLDPEKSPANKEIVAMAYTFLLEIIGSQARTDKESLAIINGAIKAIPDYSRAYAVQGIYNMKKGDLKAARANFLSALKKGEVSGGGRNREAFAYKLLGRIAEENGQRKEAAGYYRKFLDSYGKDGRSKISEGDRAEVKTYGGIDGDFLNLQGIREKLKDWE
jgi:tetratricopeptide (TPR) repeat protein